MSLDQVRYFITVAEEGNIGRAAKKLHISQPPLSRQIKGLEEELHVELFRRHPGGVDLLPAGERFLGHARRILAEVSTAKLAMAERSLNSEDRHHHPHGTPTPDPSGARPVPIEKLR